MSVRDRIEDSKLLFAAGRLEGALLAVLVAVAGTSRKRYPPCKIKGDRESFETFLKDEREKVTGGMEIKIEFDGEMRTLENILYKFARNSLSHEAALEDHVSFEYGDFLMDKRGTTDYFTFSSELVLRLSFVVATAQENKDVFPQGIYDHLPEPIDLKQFGIIKYQWGEQHFEVFCSACSVQREVWEETGESLAWLRLKGFQVFNGQVAEGQCLSLLVPAMYVSSVEPGPEYQRIRKRTTCEIGVFPPIKPVPDNAMDLTEIETRIAQLQIPMVATTVTLLRPHYDLRDQGNGDVAST